ncbi:hypothetical protein COLO4_33817 [Corchorus olitorius]|uniref:C2H2-type domain-containing protein n=1 Tax=Corchorus olitorius TaxID=93759 RepID=A0A1R3GR37_9ROSI|nr:hypothetical protein COLO4_33817 [Corchorus olitorius]
MGKSVKVSEEALDAMARTGQDNYCRVCNLTFTSLLDMKNHTSDDCLEVRQKADEEIKL